MRVAAFREELLKIDIVLVVTGVTATPLFGVKTKDQPRLVDRAGTLLGLNALEALEENTVEVSAEEAKAISAQIKPLQTSVPEAFEVRDIKIPGGEPSQEVTAIIDDAKQMLIGIALEPRCNIDRVVAFKCLPQQGRRADGARRPRDRGGSVRRRRAVQDCRCG
jgi:hypothetical protein